MRITLQTPHFLVIDDFLPSDHAEEVWKYLQIQKYSSVFTHQWKGGWRLDDGNVMQSVCNFWGDFPIGQVKYPTGLGVDLLMNALLNGPKEIYKLIGKPERDWAAMTATAMLYPRGAGLYWHQDSPSWTGSWTYYAHPEWNIQWGGHLFLADLEKPLSSEYGVYLSKRKDSQMAAQTFSSGSHLDNTDANQVLLDRGLGTYVMSKPNRLAVIKAGTPHQVTKVDTSAGDHLRASISGFFLKPKNS